MLDHGVSDVHCLVVGVTNASLDVWQVQRGFPVEEPVFFGVSVLSGKWLSQSDFLGTYSGRLLVRHVSVLTDVLSL